MDWAGGPRGMISASSVKKDESFVGVMTVGVIMITV